MAVEIDAGSYFAETFGTATSIATTTFPAVPADRIPIVGIFARATAVRTLSAVKMGGVDLTPLGEYQLAVGGAAQRISLFVGSKGQTGQVSFNYNSATARTAVSLFTISGADSVALSASVNASGSATLSASIDVPAGGLLIAGAYDANSSVAVPTWSGVDKLGDTPITGGSGTNASSEAARYFASAQTAYPISATWASGSNKTLYAVSLSAVASLAGKSGAGALSVALALTATGRKTGSGAASLSEAFSATASGRKIARSSASLSVGASLTAMGRKAASGTGALSLGVAASSVGRKVARGVTSLTSALTGSASGAKAARGAGSLSFDVAGSAAGVVQRFASAALSLAFKLTALGTRSTGRAVTPIRLKASLTGPVRLAGRFTSAIRLRAKL